MKKNRGCFSSLFLIGITVAIIAFFAAPNTKSYNRDRRVAWDAGCDFVRQRLKAPSTAKFQSIDNGHSLTISPNVWDVAGEVDAQNAFGAMLRTEWRAVIESKHGNWNLIWMKLGEDEVGSRPANVF